MTKEELKKVVEQHPELIIKTMFEVELNIHNDKKLEVLYQEYLSDDTLTLLNDWFYLSAQ